MCRGAGGGEHFQGEVDIFLCLGEVGIFLQGFAEGFDGGLEFGHVCGAGFEDDAADLVVGRGVVLIEIAEDDEEIAFGGVELADIFECEGEAIAGFDAVEIELNGVAKIADGIVAELVFGIDIVAGVGELGEGPIDVAALEAREAKNAEGFGGEARGVEVCEGELDGFGEIVASFLVEIDELLLCRCRGPGRGGFGGGPEVGGRVFLKKLRPIQIDEAEGVKGERIILRRGEGEGVDHLIVCVFEQF